MDIAQDRVRTVAQSSNWEEKTMKLRNILFAAAIAILPLSAHAEQKLADFKLADRIKAKLDAGQKLDI